jgi:hypothetical protein
LFLYLASALTASEPLATVVSIMPEYGTHDLSLASLAKMRFGPDPMHEIARKCGAVERNVGVSDQAFYDNGSLRDWFGDTAFAFILIVRGIRPGCSLNRRWTATGRCGKGYISGYPTFTPPLKTLLWFVRTGHFFTFGPNCSCSSGDLIVWFSS